MTSLSSLLLTVQEAKANATAAICAAKRLPETKDELFKEVAPFWESFGYDKEHGGFICGLQHDGSVSDDSKFSWYQGRGAWVFSKLYKMTGSEKFLKMAKGALLFTLNHCSVYLDLENEFIQDFAEFSDLIPTSSNEIHHNYILEPTDIRVNIKTGVDLFDLNIVIQSVLIKLQWFQMKKLQLLNSYMVGFESQFITNSEYRPTESPIENPKVWWKYTIALVQDLDK